MIGSICYMHWDWANCPTAWQGQYTRSDQNGPTVSLQAVVSCDIWIWSPFFGVPESNDDINVLKQSHVIEGYISNTILVASFWANDNYYPHGYYLVDGIFPESSNIKKIFRNPID
ncbi:uncharacterized protein LOC143635995 [Bidens hawaiensis]|uniref:uncharacterized protein LOC143635995 n=1 Tax=Bidens hawaiensis TaxID=980011 RepID=UPI00404A575F